MANPNRDEAARAAKAAATRVQHLHECYGPPHRWELVRRAFDPLGRQLRSGYRAKHFVFLRCLEHPDEGEVAAGFDEAHDYAGVQVRRLGPGRPKRRRSDFSSFFARRS